MKFSLEEYVISEIKELIKDDPNGSEYIKTLLYDEGGKMDFTTEQLDSLLIKMELPEKKPKKR